MDIIRNILVPDLVSASMQSVAQLSPDTDQTAANVASAAAALAPSVALLSNPAMHSHNFPSLAASSQNSGTPSQKDFAIALGVSQARISQLVKIGMPLNSIAAAKEWRMKRQRSSDDIMLEGADAVESPDSAAGACAALVERLANAASITPCRVTFVCSSRIVCISHRCPSSSKVCGCYPLHASASFALYVSLKGVFKSTSKRCDGLRRRAISISGPLR